MQTLVGIFRTESDLDEAIGRIGELRRRWSTIRVGGGRAYNPGWNLVTELRNLIIVSESVVRSARLRTESRGAHSRLDYPAADATWAKMNCVTARDGESMRVETAPLPGLPAELGALAARG
jgi:succinate dehydrogenase / fumarate reductase flavoprotein subunit